MPWNWKVISENKNITRCIIKDNLNKPWNLSNIIKNQNITWEIIENHPNMP